MSRLAAVEAQLLAPGAPFELAEEEVLGERVRVFANRARSLRDVLLRAREFAGAEYMVFRDGERERRYTFGDHEKLVASAAAALSDQFDIGPGDRVAILAANCPEWIISFWATVSLGAICAGLNGWWTEDEIRYAVGHSKPKVVIADRRRAARITGDLGVPLLVVEDEFDDLLAGYPAAELPTQPIAEYDPAIILYTSGTTGRAKGVVHTHGNVTNMLMVSFFHGARLMMANPKQAELPQLANSILVTSPLFHVSGLHCAAVTALAAGAKTVWPMGRFDPETTLGLIEREKVTGWGYTATVLHRLIGHAEAGHYDLSSFRSVGGGGSPIPAPLIEKAKALFPQCSHTMGVGYGLTEGTAFATLNAGEELTDDPASVGRPVPVVEVEIRDDRGRSVGEGEEGEIHLRGPLVMREYWDDAEATTAAIKPGRWLNTGDVGRLHNGKLYIASRKRDLILRGGENVYPFEIEQRLEAHPAIEEAAVIGVDHAELGQEVKAVIVFETDQEVAPEALQRWVADALAYYKVPSLWETRKEPLPRNATGKVLKNALRDTQDSMFIEE
ncbi:MAG: acyl--CoA ligase [Deltaproteobacteria bacterium]|nr:acyl--CoA ligase [Deltaproteobacteria bacterium]MBW1874411.1 acyl--CoA ligase [Deltaproteobacteria bacterium]MBW2209601.1 acyl--CoA ligase [Deltaproteobacteria bacterium]MBW2214035.1 acyl--CoA ligase [Deltaproteobacteria bacterium]MBW2378322.1 acyl--CoA ligase [Deltaproteobacteria bacterium]